MCPQPRKNPNLIWYYLWEKLNRGVSKPGCFPLFSGKVQIVSRTLSGLFLVGALNRPRKRKRTNRENPRTIPEQIGKNPRESPKRTKKDKKGQKGRTSPDRETPPFETPPFSGPWYLKSRELFSYCRWMAPEFASEKRLILRSRWWSWWSWWWWWWWWLFLSSQISLIFLNPKTWARAHSSKLAF